MPNVVDYFFSSSRFDTGEILFKLSKDATPHSYFNAHLQIVKIEVSLVHVPYIMNTYLPGTEDTLIIKEVLRWRGLSIALRTC